MVWRKIVEKSFLLLFVREVHDGFQEKYQYVIEMIYLCALSILEEALHFV